MTEPTKVKSQTDLAQSELLKLLVCPRDKQGLHHEGTHLVCDQGHAYAVIEGIPILLVPDVEQTHIEGTRSLDVAESGNASTLAKFDLAPNEIDPFVRASIGATNGGLYQHLVGNLTEYPIPSLRLPPGEKRTFLEVGCNWGRWCIAAARLGYRPVGIDPSLKSIRAAYRVARQLGVEAAYVVADGRYLPFRDQTFDQAFSYSVLQHLSKENARASLAEIRRTLRPGGNSLIQLPNVYGLRCLYHQVRRGFREARDFEVRYWRPSELRSAFTEMIGPSELSVDGFFSLNVQPSDLHLMPARYRAVVHASESLRRVSAKVPILTRVADSLYISAHRME
ncbi:MAG TPA: methyltransferase domain-containing protein [Candidatus Dormibacteraeota bacterium]|nr:methyltransferase domain-containing protein [Candidatus Dormibacteraeota bacterium]